MIFLSGFITGALLTFSAIVLLGHAAEERERKQRARAIKSGAKVIVNVEAVELRYE